MVDGDILWNVTLEYGLWLKGGEKEVIGWELI